MFDRFKKKKTQDAEEQLSPEADHGTMKTSQPAFFLLFFAGMALMSFFGSEISRSIGRSPDSWTAHVMLPGYSLGLIVISASMCLRLSSQIRDLESKVRKLEDSGS